MDTKYRKLLEDIKFDDKGLIPAIAFDQKSQRVVMQAYMNSNAIRLTLESGYVHYYSRSRQEIWRKGDTSGNTQKLISMRLDCDGDSILLIIDQKGNACHTGHQTCFYREITPDFIIQQVTQELPLSAALELDYNIIVDRATHPIEGSYTNYLLDKGIDKILKKVGEETAEIIIAAKNPDQSELRYETADLLYHLSVLLFNKGLTWEDINEEITSRRKPE